MHAAAFTPPPTAAAPAYALSAEGEARRKRRADQAATANAIAARQLGGESAADRWPDVIAAAGHGPQTRAKGSDAPAKPAASNVADPWEEILAKPRRSSALSEAFR